jgi:GrpB-like predicted nucleotidyltransferase (UPF0157 family)
MAERRYAFRDYLRAHPEEKQAYEKEKQKNATSIQTIPMPTQMRKPHGFEY